MSSWMVDGKLPTKNCTVCGTPVPVRSRDRWDRTKYCSMVCKHEGLRLKPGVHRDTALLPCTGCGLTLDRSMFGSDASRKSRGGRSYRCIPCAREHSKGCALSPEAELKKVSDRFKARYGITLEDYEELCASQGGVCAICSRPPAGQRKDGSLKRLHVDHDHRTGRVRGLLCFDCNTALGKFGDGVEMLKRAIAYLDEPDWV